MNGRSIAVVVGIVAAPLGLFRRREKDEWLGELAEIRNEALGVHGAGLDHATPPAPLLEGEIDQHGPDAPSHPAEVRGAVPPADDGAHPVVDHGGPAGPPATEPVPELAAEPVPEPAAPGAEGPADPAVRDGADRGDGHDPGDDDQDDDAAAGLRAPGWAARDAAAALPAGPRAGADAGPDVAADLSPFGGRTDGGHGAVVVDAGGDPVADTVVEPSGVGAPVEPDHLGVAPPGPDPHVVGAAAVQPGVDPAPAPAPASEAPPADRRPEPHRQRPGELWHPALDLTLVAPVEIQPEERIDPSELVEPDPDPVFATRARPFIGGPGPTTDDPHAAAAGLDLGVAGPGGIAPDVLDDVEPPTPEVLTARDLDDGPASGPGLDDDHDAAALAAAGGRAVGSSGGAGDAPAAAGGPERPRIRPPSEVFDGPPAGTASDWPARPPARSTAAVGDHAPAAVTAAVTDEGAGTVAGERSLVGEPVSRRRDPGSSRRSLFGNPLAPAPGGPDPQDGPPADGPPAAGPSSAVPGPTDGVVAGPDPGGDGSEPAPSTVAGLELLALGDDGMVALDAGIVRLAPGLRPEVTRLGGTVGLTLGSGWCWVASTATADPVLLTLPAASLLVPPGGHALTVVEGDGSVFVSVVRGTATLDRPGGNVALPVGTIAHLRNDGTVHTDQATPEEMATDEILTRNLLLDEQRSS